MLAIRRLFEVFAWRARNSGHEEYAMNVRVGVCQRKVKEPLRLCDIGRNQQFRTHCQALLYFYIVDKSIEFA